MYQLWSLLLIYSHESHHREYYHKRIHTSSVEINMNQPETCFLYRNCMVICPGQYNDVVTSNTCCFCPFKKVRAKEPVFRHKKEQRFTIRHTCHGRCARNHALNKVNRLANNQDGFFVNAKTRNCAPATWTYARRARRATLTTGTRYPSKGSSKLANCDSASSARRIQSS